jgi:hypothetical protein
MSRGASRATQHNAALRPELRVTSHARKIGPIPSMPKTQSSDDWKTASALLPLAMSLSALSVVALHVAVYGTAREADEGAAAHIWQLLMAGQLPVMLFFLATHLTKAPRQTLAVLAAQVGAALAALAPVYFLGL